MTDLERIKEQIEALRGTGYLESDWDWQEAFDSGLDAALDVIRKIEKEPDGVQVLPPS